MAKTEVVEAKKNELAMAISFADDAGQGMEGTSAESFAIPFLTVLQKGSPQVDEASGKALDGAKAGMLYDTVTGALFNGKEGIRIVPCAYRRTFLRWAPKGEGGGGFRGEIPPDEVVRLRAEGKVKDVDGRLYIAGEDGTVSPQRSDRIGDTRNHYVLFQDPTTKAWREALLSLTSTQIKKSKMLMSALASVKVQGPQGLFTPPTFANYVRLTTAPESNDKGTWFGVRFELDGSVDDAATYSAAKYFHASVSKGAVDVKYEDGGEDKSEGGF